MAIVFLIMTVLGLPSCFLFYSGNTQFQTNLKGIIAVTSLGNIGDGIPTCANGGRVTDLKKERRKA